MVLEYDARNAEQGSFQDSSSVATGGWALCESGELGLLKRIVARQTPSL